MFASSSSSSTCQILLDNYNGQFYQVGATIQGRISLILDSDITLRGIKCKLVGREHTEWIGTERYYDNESREQKSEDTRFVGDREVVGIEQCLYGHVGDTVKLTRGQYVYPFVIQLSPNLPGSYKNDIYDCAIQYCLEVTVDRPMAFDLTDKMSLVIRSPVDLNFIARPDDLKPLTLTEDKTVCCWCCTQGAISMETTIPRLVMTSADVTDVIVKVTNMSNTNVEAVTLELFQNLTFKVTDPNRDEKLIKNCLVQLSDVGVGAHGENSYQFKVVIPPNAQLPNFSQCALFKVDYCLITTVKLPSVHKNLELRFYPKIGHVNLMTGGGTSSLTIMPTAPPDEEFITNKELPPSYDSLKFKV